MNIDHLPQINQTALSMQQTIATLIAERDKLRTANERLELALAASGVVGLWDWMVNSNLLHGDANFARLYGLDPMKAASGLTMEDYQAFVVVDDLPALQRDIRETFERGTDFLVEYRLAIPGRILRWVECKGKLINDDAGNPYRFSGTAIDITDMKLANEESRMNAVTALENAERVQLALHAGAIIGTWVWDVQKNQFVIDSGFAHAFGLDPALGHHGITLEQIVETVHPDDKTDLAKAISKAVESCGTYMHQYRVKRANGLYYWVEANGRVERGANGLPMRFPGVLIDISTRRDLEIERDRVSVELRELNLTLEQRVIERTSALVAAQDALRQSQKMEAVGQLTGGLAHDFNNLLAGISGALQLMQIRSLNGQFNDLERYILMAQDGVNRAASLTHRLLAFSRRQTLDPRPADVNRLVADMFDLIKRTVGPGIVVDAVTAAGLWPALVDSSQLENALLNLCLNARDAMPEGGRITIETANRWLDDDTALSHDMAPGQYLSLCVTDSGTGIAPELFDKIFEPFFTTKPLGEGTGLGLSMVYGFAKQSGGQVRIYSEVGRGTTVCVYLPRSLENIEEARPAEELTPPSTLKKRTTVLVVEDEPIIRSVISEMLKELGYNVLEASDSTTGLEILKSNAHIDLLISDVGLPGGLNGRQMADAGRLERPALKVLFLTGYAEDAIIRDGHLSSGMQVLTKPFDMQTLISRIKSLIDAVG